MASPRQSSSSEPFDWNAINDLFKELFQKGPPPSADISAILVVTASGAAEGGWHGLVVERRVHCPSCNPAGGTYRKAERGCGTCDGAGEVRTLRGQVSLTSVCPECGGKPRVTSVSCGRCTGGLIAREEKLKVRVPPGTNPGQTLRLAGKGHERVGGTAGDLYVEVLIEGASSGVGPLRAPLAGAPELPARCFACAGRSEITRVPVAVGDRVDARASLPGRLLGLLGLGSAVAPRPTVALPLCPPHRGRLERRARWTASLAELALVAGLVLLVVLIYALLSWGAWAVAVAVSVSVAAVVGTRWALFRSEARSLLHVGLDRETRELVFPPLGGREG